MTPREVEGISWPVTAMIVVVIAMLVLGALLGIEYYQQCWGWRC